MNLQKRNPTFSQKKARAEEVRKEVINSKQKGAFMKVKTIILLLIASCCLTCCAHLSASLDKQSELVNKYRGRKSRITNNYDGTLTQTFDDTDKKLMWLQDIFCFRHNYHRPFHGPLNEYSVFSYEQANEVIHGMNDGKYPLCSGKYTDWRLPTIDELWNLSGYHGYFRSNNLFMNVDPDDKVQIFYSSDKATTVSGDKMWGWSPKTGVMVMPKQSIFGALWPVRDVKDQESVVKEK
jgi:hypothetical protein